MNQSIEKYEKTGYLGEYEQIATKEYVTMADGTALLVYSTKAPEKNRSPYTLFFVPGWASVILGWDSLLMEAKDTFDIYYYESREKKSSKLNWDTKVYLDDLSDDLVTIIEYYNLEQDKLILLGSCYGSMVLGHAMVQQRIDPFMPIMFGPPARLDVPKGTRRIIKHVPYCFYIPILPIVLFFARSWLKRKKSESKEQLAKYLRVLDEMDFKKNLFVAHNIITKKNWEMYAQINNKVLIVDAEKDKMHQSENSKKIKASMENSLYANLGTNKNAHSKPMLDLILEYLPKFE